MIRFPQIFYSPDGGGGDGGAGAAQGGGDTAATWHSEYAYFKDNPNAVKAFAQFKSPDDVFKSYDELRNAQSQPFRMPKDTAKLTDEQRAEFKAGLAKLNGVPETPEAYEFEIPDDATIDEQALGEFRKLAHERGLDPQTAKDLVGLQLGMVKRLNDHRAKVIQGMTDNNYKTFLNEDCKGDKDVAAATMENIKRLLQSQFTKGEQLDTAGWEKFAARIYHGDRIIELPILRALKDAAQMQFGTGGSPGSPGSFGQGVMGNSKLYKEMRQK